MKKLILIKFGGSLITDKTKINKARFDVIKNLSGQVKKIIENNKDLFLIIATGAGGYGHPVAKRFENNLEKGLPKIKKAVKKINSIVVDELNKVGVKAESVEPSRIVEYKNGKLTSLFRGSIVSLLDKNIIPVLHADLIDDQELGTSILSMDRLLVDMAIHLKNKNYNIEKVFFCGTTDGVLDNQGKTITRIYKKNMDKLASFFYDNKIIDTSGGMKGKVSECIRLISEKIPCTIINGQKDNYLYKAVLGEDVERTDIIE